jgi:hypothetical protein
MKWRNIFIPRKLVHALNIEVRALKDVVQHGLPDVMLQFLGGIGDELLLTAVARELKKRNPNLKIWQVSYGAEILFNNPDYTRVFDWNHQALRHALFLNSRRCKLDGYAEEKIPPELFVPPEEHVLTILSRKAGINGQIALRPYFHFADSEKNFGSFAKRQITVQFVGENSWINMKRNKLWDFQKFQTVVNSINDGIFGADIKVVQIGSDKDPLLEGLIDLRGKTNLRQSAAVLSNSDCYIGFAGLLSHLARAVECRSVIIYGGQEHSFQTGYICNENLDSHVECAPCWRWNTCDYGRKCMEIIEPDDVLGAVQNVLSKKGVPLETQTVVI